MPGLDVGVLVVYLLLVVAFGCTFVRRSREPGAFMVAGSSLGGWVVGLSIFGTFLSSNTFLGVPGNAFSGNWSSFVFSLSLPLAALVAVRTFVPFHRRSGHISAYEHLEERFAPWARSYGLVCYLLTQVARIGSILFGVAIGLNALTGWPLATIIVVVGALVTLYTVLGGIEAVIWTDVVQSVVLFAGAVLIATLLVVGTPGGFERIVDVGLQSDKWSLGGFGAALSEPTFWVVLLYGFFINLNNFGIDQSYVQRYHAATSEREAKRSVWLAALLYLPISALFFFIGTALFVHYQTQPELLEPLRQTLANEGTGDSIGDRVLPHFIASSLPPGAAGLLVAAIVAAAMSSIDTSLNSSATVLVFDFYRRYLRPRSDPSSMKPLYGFTVAMGALGTIVAVSMIGVGSLLDAWWTLSGIFSGGLLGLFLLGLLVRRARSVEAAVAVTIGVAVILWMSVGAFLPPTLQSPFHSNLIVVIGTLAIFLVGAACTRLRRAWNRGS